MNNVPYKEKEHVWFYVTAAKHAKAKGLILRLDSSHVPPRYIIKPDEITKFQLPEYSIPFSQIIERVGGHKRRTL